MFLRILIGVVIFLQCCLLQDALYSQSEPQDLHNSSKWKPAIEKFEAEHLAMPKPRGAILFVGSSSIRKWNLEESFPELITINHGFGGSQLADSVQFIDQLVLKHKPQSVVLYAGDNDINARKSPERVFADFTEFVAILQKKLPKTTLHFIAIKPSIARWKLIEKNRRANKLISQYCSVHDKLFFVDIDAPMLRRNGKPITKLFAPDGLHLSESGYEVWNKAIRKSLNKPGGTPLKIVDKNRRRVIVLTDIANEPDDEQSLVRFLCYANQFEVEGLIATTSCWLKDTVVPQRIIERVEAYGKVLPNLVKHAEGWPTEKELMSVVKSSIPEFGMKGVGIGMNSSGSNQIIKVVDRPDPRPVYVSVWGGSNCLAQALWQIKKTRSEEELEVFVSKLRVYAISDQDDSGPWMRKEFPNLFYIVSPGQGEKNVKAYELATWNGISGDKYLGKFPGPDFSIVDNPWLDKNIRLGHGPLGALHPQTKYLMEGDTPAFLWLVNNGLNHPENPSFGGWGGRYELYAPPKQAWHLQQVPRPIWTDAMDTVQGTNGKEKYRSNQATIWRWREAYQNDFAARIDWSNTDDPAKANHAPQIVIEGESSNSIITRSMLSGTSIELKTKTTDQDGDTVQLEWMQYMEAGTCQDKAKIETGESSVRFFAPEVNSPKTIHLIAQAKDDGSPNLTAYRRIILTVLPSFNSNLPDQRPRVFITTDIATGDPDDRQAFCHLLLYADQLDIRGIALDRFTPSSFQTCEMAIQQYEFDYNSPWTKFRQFGYPTADKLRSLLLTDRETTHKRLVAEIEKQDPRPLYILAWGDLTSAYKAINEVGKKSIDQVGSVRLLSIATNRLANKDNGTGLLKNWNSPARQELFTEFNQLWWIENDWTYNGMYAGPEPLAMKKFLAEKAGRLGKHISDVVDAVDWADNFRAGPTPTVLYLIDPKNKQIDPAKQSWAGKFHRPSPQIRPNYWTGVVGDLKWDYKSPNKTWENADKVFQLRVNTFLKTRAEVYTDLRAKVASLYGTEFTYKQQQILDKEISTAEQAKAKTAKPTAVRVGPK